MPQIAAVCRPESKADSIDGGAFFGHSDVTADYDRASGRAALQGWGEESSVAPPPNTVTGGGVVGSSIMKRMYC